MSPLISKLFASRFGQAVIVAGAYYLAARVSLLMAPETTNTINIWPPLGIALAAVLMLGNRIWPAIALAAFFANLDTFSVIGFTSPPALAGAFVTAVGNTLEVLAGGLLVRRFTEGRNPFGRTMDIIKFVLFGALLSTTVSGIFGAGTLCVLNGRWDNFGLTWLTWWLGDAVGILIITPLIMTWESRRKSGWTPLKITEVACILALLAVIGWVVFGKGFTLPYMFIPVFIWIAFRFGLFEGACFTLLILLISLWGAAEGVFVYHEVTHTFSLLLTQLFISIVSVMSMLLTSLINERDAAFADLKGSNEDLLQEINERKRAEERIRASLVEKEVLLKEIHHRVKNNLQIISTLLDLQFEDIQDEHARTALRASQDRLMSMALVHEKLYQTMDHARIDFAGYLASLTSHLWSSYVADQEQISLRIVVGDVALPIDKAIPCGLIINELVSNSMKHAFPDGRKGNITIHVQADDQGVVTLAVTDDGVGLPPDTDFRDTETMGLQLVNMLTKQLRGELSFSIKGETAFTIRFKG